MNSVTLSESAIKQITTILEDTPGSVVRVSVFGGGCSGFQYRFNVDAVMHDDDLIVEANNVKLVAIDSMSLAYMVGSEIDYVTEVMSAAFKVNNPAATGCCGCGESFNI